MDGKDAGGVGVDTRHAKHKAEGQTSDDPHFFKETHGELRTTMKPRGEELRTNDRESALGKTTKRHGPSVLLSPHTRGFPPIAYPQ